MTVAVNQALVKEYIKGTQRHAAYIQAVDIAHHLQFHIEGFKAPYKPAETLISSKLGLFLDENPYFTYLIDKRRPGESVRIHEYRRVIYAPITMEPTGRVINTLSKITRSEDWKIDYTNAETLNKVGEGEQLEDYAEKNYPGFVSITNWAHTFGIEKTLSDPNGLIVVMPLDFKPPANEFLKPFAHFIPSKHLLFYKPDEIAVFLSNKTEEIIIDRKRETIPVYQIVTKEGIWESKKMDAKNNFSLERVMTFNMEALPAWLAGGKFKKFINNIPLYLSFLNPMLPRLDEASREYSDLQAEKVQHIHSTLAVMQTQDCNKCSGRGKVIKKGKPIVCGDCKGLGSMAINPYEQVIVKPQGIDKQDIPFPPLAYIEKNVEIVEIQDKGVEHQLFKALAAINMEFLAKTPLVESGKAKEVDKDDGNNFVYGFAFHLIKNTFTRVYKATVAYRYGSDVLGLPKESLEKALPLIQVPEHFDLLTETALMDQLAKAKEAGVDPTIINEMQTDLINKKFKDNPSLREALRISNAMNPFNTSTKEEIANMELAGLISKPDAVQALYADYFVQKAIEKDAGFIKKTFEQQLEEIKKMVDAKVLELTPKPPVDVPATD